MNNGMRTTLRSRQYLSPLQTMGRPLVCTHCGTLVDLVEIDLTAARARHWIEADSYVCGPCLQPIAVSVRAPEPPAPPETARDRILAGTYDPAKETIPF